MPISKYNQDGTVDIYNTKTGEVRTGVFPEELSTISPKLTAEYQKGQTVESRASRVTAEAEIQKAETPEGALKPAQVSIVENLEDLFFGEEKKESLAFGKEGFGGRLPGVAKGIERKVSPGEPGSAVERLNTYTRTLESIRPQLAKMAGDAGNIAFSEQLQAGKGLPMETDTPTEAIAIMQAARSKFGLEPSEELEQLRQELTGELPELQNGLTEKPPELGATEEFEGRGFIDKLFSVEAIKKFATEAPGIAAEGLALTPSVAAALSKGDIEEARRINEEFRPQVERVQELDEAAREEISTKIGTVTGLAALKSFVGKQLAKRGAKRGAVEVSDEILKPAIDEIKRGGDVRNQAIKIVQDAGKKVNGSTAFKVVKEWGDDAARGATKTEKKQILELVNDSNKRFNGKMLSPDTAKKAWDAANKGFNQSGKLGPTVKSGWHNAIRTGVRSELDNITGGGFEAGTKIIHEGFKLEKLLKPIGMAEGKQVIKGAIGPSTTKKFLKSTGGKIVGGAATGLGLAGIAKLLGIEFPSAARPQE